MVRQVATIAVAVLGIGLLLWFMDYLWRHAPRRHRRHGYHASQGSYGASLRRWADGKGDPEDPLEPEFQPKIGRNEPCPCGSGKKYKRCHGRGEKR